MTFVKIVTCCVLLIVESTVIQIYMHVFVMHDIRFELRLDNIVNA
jgi:hypothetical protein